MARPPGEHKLDHQERKRQKLAVPPKSQPIRHYLVQLVNGWRLFRRARYRTARYSASAFAWVGEEYECPICHRMVLLRQADRHNREHRNRMEKPQKLKPLSADERAQQPRPEPVRKPGKVKQQAVVARQPAAPTPIPARSKWSRWKKPPATPDDPPSKTRQSWQEPIENLESNMTGRPRRNGTANGSSGADGGGGGVPASSAAAAFLKAVQAWCETDCETVADMKAHYLGMDAAVGAAADMLHQHAAQMIVAKKIHPGVAAPIDAAADDWAANRHYFSEAYIRFEQIYADRLSYARSNVSKPDEKIFSDVG